MRGKNYIHFKPPLTGRYIRACKCLESWQPWSQPYTDFREVKNYSMEGLRSEFIYVYSTVLIKGRGHATIVLETKYTAYIDIVKTN